MPNSKIFGSVESSIKKRSSKSKGSNDLPERKIRRLEHENSFDKEIQIDSDDDLKNLYGLMAAEMMSYVTKTFFKPENKVKVHDFYTHSMFVFEEVQRGLDGAGLLSKHYDLTKVCNKNKFYKIAIKNFDPSKIDEMMLAFSAYVIHEGLATSTRKCFSAPEKLQKTFALMYKLNFLAKDKEEFMWTDQMGKYFEAQYEWDGNGLSVEDIRKKY